MPPVFPTIWINRLIHRIGIFTLVLWAPEAVVIANEAAVPEAAAVVACKLFLALSEFHTVVSLHYRMNYIQLQFD